VPARTGLLREWPISRPTARRSAWRSSGNSPHVPAQEQPRGPTPPAHPGSARPARRDPLDDRARAGQPPVRHEDIIWTVLDDHYFFEVHEAYGRFDGRPVGIVAHQPAHLAGCLDISASLKGLRALLRPLQHPAGDLRGPSRLPARAAPEYLGFIKHGAKLLYAFCEAMVPKVTVFTRKAYGGPTASCRSTSGRSQSRGTTAR
jgi:Carboxyl transferase domain